MLPWVLLASISIGIDIDMGIEFGMLIAIGIDDGPA